MRNAMRLSIRHVTTYDYGAPIGWGLGQLRLTPKATRAQRVLSWDVSVEGGRRELCFKDHNRNHVDLVSFEPEATRLVIEARGEVEVDDAAGVHGPHGGFAPLWLFERVTPRTQAGQGCLRIIEALPVEPRVLARLHDLSAAVAEAVTWTEGAGDAGRGAEEALAAGTGVCQDQAHVFIACARAMGIPARYVSGHLLLDGRDEAPASHAWAEAWVPDLGWVGFDVANAMCPDDRYVRVATGLDYAEAAPVSGTRQGAGPERLAVSVEVAAR
jgi:transglutaminase-like putative cysteine protease